MPGLVGFATCLRAMRTAHGWTQAELARRVGMVQPNIARFEAGQRLPSWATVQRFAEALGVSTEAFRDRDE